MKELSGIPHVVPVLAPITYTDGTKVYTDVVNTKYANKIEFICMFGAMVGDVTVVTVEECSNVTPSATTALASWKYRKSSAVGTDSMGSVASSSSTAATGITITNSTDDGKSIVISIDPAELTEDYPYVRVAFDPGASASSIPISAVCLIWPRYVSDSVPSNVV
jgi:hypothetical protein